MKSIKKIKISNAISDVHNAVWRIQNGGLCYDTRKKMRQLHFKHVRLGIMKVLIIGERQ